MLKVEQILYEEYPKLFDGPTVVTKIVVSLMQQLLHEQKINTFLQDNPKRGVAFVEAVLEHLDLSYKTDNRELLNIPTLGKCIVVSNHPLGALDALVLIHMLSSVRQEKKVKIVANKLLSRLEPLEEMIIPVDNISGKLTKASVILRHQLNTRKLKSPIRGEIRAKRDEDLAIAKSKLYLFEDCLL